MCCYTKYEIFHPISFILVFLHSLEIICSRNKFGFLSTGRIFNDVLKTKHLFYQVGEFIAKIDSALKRFTHDAYENHKSLWSLESVPQLGKFLYAVEDPKKQTIVKEVLSEFNAHVLARADQFAKGVIHGDCNEHNIVVTKTSPESDEFRVTGVIDFGDTCKTLYVFELAITIAYMLLQSCELETAGFVIAGYQELRPIPDNERHVLKVLGQFKPKHTPKNNCFLL